MIWYGHANRDCAALVITGEGTLDSQTAEGKTPIGVARIAKAQGVPVIAVAGALGNGYRQLYNHGIDAAFSIAPGPIEMAEAVAEVRALLADTAETVMRAWQAAGRHLA